jgi:hypothetical protein
MCHCLYMNRDRLLLIICSSIINYHGSMLVPHREDEIEITSETIKPSGKLLGHNNNNAMVKRRITTKTIIRTRRIDNLAANFTSTTISDRHDVTRDEIISQTKWNDYHLLVKSFNSDKIQEKQELVNYKRGKSSTHWKHVRYE